MKISGIVKINPDGSYTPVEKEKAINEKEKYQRSSRKIGNKLMKKLPSYFKTDKPVSLNVFGVIDDTLGSHPELLKDLKVYLRAKEE